MGFLTQASPAILYSLTAGCFLIAVPILLWALFADRSRGRKRCPRCWYDMDAATTLTCPECGRTVKHAARFHRTRRRWRFAIPAILLMLIGLGVGISPVLRGEHWSALLPDVVLVRFAPRDESFVAQASPGWKPNPFGTELRKRIQAGRLSPALILSAIQQSRALRYRKKWPKDRPFVVESNIPLWLVDTAVTLTPRDQSLPRIVIKDSFTGLSHLRQDPWTDFGVLPPGTKALTFDVEIAPSSRVGVPALLTGKMTLGAWTIDVELVDSAAEAVPAIASTQPPLWIAMEPREAWHDARSSRFMAFQPDSAAASIRHDFSYQAQLLENGHVRAVSPLHMLALNDTVLGLEQHPRREIFTVPFTSDQLQNAVWTIRLVPDPVAALTNWDITSIDGRTFEYAVAECLPPPPNFVEPDPAAP